jgi:hypothetical protein
MCITIVFIHPVHKKGWAKDEYKKALTDVDEAG